MAVMDALDQLLGVDTTQDIAALDRLYREMETPELMSPEYETLRDTELSNISLDPRSRDAQTRALDLISELAETGMTAEDMAALNRINRQADAQARQQRGALQQQFARQGSLGGGAAMAAQMAANQQASDMAALRGLEQAGQAAARRQGAIGQMAQQGGQLRGQDYGIASDRARAQDAIRQFNTQTRNRQMDMANQLRQQGFENRLGITDRRAGATREKLADTRQKRAGAYGALGSAAQTGGQMLQQAGTAAAMMSDRNLKENIVDGKPAIEEFLNTLPISEYNYEDAKFGNGRYVSPMAQDLEKTKLGRDLVVDTPEGKMVDYGKGFGLMLSAMANISQRLDKLGV